MLAPSNPSRPENWSRSAVHVGAAIFSLTLLHELPQEGSRLVAVGAAGFCWSVEIVRQRSKLLNGMFHKVVGGMIHAHEHRQAASGTYFATGLAVVSFFPAPAAAAAIGVLGFGDPAAGAIGRRWGRTRLAQGRSVEGSAAFLLAGTLAAAVVLAMGWPYTPYPWALAAAAGIVGAVAEVLLRRIDDNLTVPLFSGIAATVVAQALG